MRNINAFRISMNKFRLNLRLPDTLGARLEHIARRAGYSSTAQLARCLLVQFAEKQKEVERQLTQQADWVDEVVEDHLDPRNRKRINERL